MKYSVWVFTNGAADSFTIYQEMRVVWVDNKTKRLELPAAAIFFLN